MISTLTVSAVFLAAASTVTAGNAIIKNQCSDNVFLSVVSNTAGDIQTISPGDTYSSPYLINSNGGGVSLKLSNTAAMTSVAQFEYTVGSGEWTQLWYDISLINGNPFQAGGMTITGSGAGCRDIVCEAGVPCGQAYNMPDDNWATASCDNSEGDLTMVICPGGGSNGGDGSSDDKTTAAPAPTSTWVPAPTSTPEPTPTPFPSPSSTEEPSTTATPTPSTTAIPTPSTTSTPTPSTTFVAGVMTTAPVQVGGVATTFVTKVMTVTADPPATTAAPVTDSQSDADWSIFHHPASLGAFWSPSKREEAENQRMHKRMAHRHHFNRHATSDE